MAWHEANRRDVRAFQVWRVYDEANPSQVSAATWNKGWAALRHFYDWATVEKHWVDDNPVGQQDRLRSSTKVGGYREKNARSSRDRWITPFEYAMWRDVGLRGYRAQRDQNGRIVAGFQNSAARSRNTARNVAFTNYVMTSGLRLEEVGTLLDFETPSSVDEEAVIIAKGGIRRHYRVLNSLGLNSLQAYRVGERRDAVLRAQRSGRYELSANRLMVVEMKNARNGQSVRLSGGVTRSVAEMSNYDRSRLFVHGEGGLEPAWLWLCESGKPLQVQSWSKIFDASNVRVSAARAELGIANPGVRVTAHSLRFSFALLVLLAEARAIDERLGLGDADPFIEHNYRVAFETVRDLLGHASESTTRDYYLEPLKGLRRSSILRSGSASDMWEALIGASRLVGFGRGA